MTDIEQAAQEAMKAEDREAKAFRAFLDVYFRADMDWEEERIRSYSGRCMFGKQCVGITTDSVPMTMLHLCGGVSRVLSLEDPSRNMQMEEFAEMIRDDVHTDSMGRSVIMYFPEIAWDEDVFQKWCDEVHFE